MRQIIVMLLITFFMTSIYSSDNISLQLINRFGFTQHYYTQNNDMLFIEFPFIYGTGTSSLQVYKIDENNEMNIIWLTHLLNTSSMVKFEDYIYISLHRVSDDKPASIIQFDISDPYNPVLSDSLGYDLSVSHIYLRELNGILQTYVGKPEGIDFDLYDLSSFDYIGTIDGDIIDFNFLNSLNDTLAYNIVRNDIISEYSVAIYDCTDITNPIILNTIDISSIYHSGYRPQHFSAVSDSVLAMCSQMTISFWDLSDLVEWEFLSQYTPDSVIHIGNNHMILDENNVILLGFDGLELLDISDIYEPQSVDFYYEQGLTNPIYHDNYLYCSSTSKGGIRTFLIDTEEETISFDNKFHTQPLIRNGTIHSDYIYIQSANDGIYMYDVSEPFNPQIIYLDVLSVSYYHGMKIKDNRLILQDYSEYQNESWYFRIYDILEPTDPILTHSIEFNEFWEFGTSLVHFDDYEDDTFYIISRLPTTRIRKYDISQAGNPVLLFDESFPNINMHSAQIINGHAYISNAGNSALFIVGDLYENEPYTANIVPVFMIGDPYLWKIDEKLVASIRSHQTNPTEPHFYDISDPVNPAFLFQLDTISDSNIAFCDKIVMIQQDPGWIIKNVYDIREVHTGILSSIDTKFDTNYYTLLCYEYEDKELVYAISPSHISLYELTITPISADDPAILPPEVTFANFPNPFNTETTFAINLPQISEDAVIELYNIKGQLLRKLELPPSEEATTHITWDGRDSRGRVAASGIYLAKLRNGSDTYTHKVVLLK